MSHAPFRLLLLERISIFAISDPQRRPFYPCAERRQDPYCPEDNGDEVSIPCRSEESIHVNCLLCMHNPVPTDEPSCETTIRESFPAHGGYCNQLSCVEPQIRTVEWSRIGQWVKNLLSRSRDIVPFFLPSSPLPLPLPLPPPREPFRLHRFDQTAFSIPNRSSRKANNTKITTGQPLLLETAFTQAVGLRLVSASRGNTACTERDSVRCRLISC